MAAGIERELSAPVQSAGKSAGGVLKGALLAGGGLAAAKGISDSLHGALDAARESNRVSAQTEAVIRSTGGAAGLSANQFGDLANSISRKTGVDDEAIQSGENLLATFTNVRNEAGKGNDIFNQSTKTLVDMAAAMGGEPKDAAIQLGKALNDPIKGISALSRVGVTFTAQQKEQIKAMVAAGDVAGAQKVILAELGKEFGGSAAAQATASDKLDVAMGNLQERIGTALVPVVDKLASSLNVGLDIFNSLPGPVKALTPVVLGLAAGIAVLVAIQKVHNVLQAVTAEDTILYKAAQLAAAAASHVWAGAQAVLNAVLSANPISLVVIAIAALVAGVILAYQHSETFRNIVQGAFEAVKVAVSTALAVFTTIGTVVARVIGGAVTFLRNNWQTVIVGILTGPVGLAVLAIAKHWDQIVGFVKGLPGRITAAAAGMWDGIKNAFKAAINWIIRGWNSLQFKLPSVDTHIPGVGKIGGWTLGTPDIPLLAGGGVIDRPTLAVLGESARARPEIVAPEPMLRAIVRQEGGRGGPLVGELHQHLHGVDPDEAGRAQMRILRRLAVLAGSGQLSTASLGA